MKKKIRLLVVESRLLIRQALRCLLAEEPELELAGEASDMNEALGFLADAGDDVILVIGRMANYWEAFDLVKRVTKNREAKILAFPPEGDLNRYYVTKMLTSGALGCADRNCGFEEMVKGIRRIARGKRFLSDEATEALAENHVPEKLMNGRDKGAELTPRQQQVTKHIAEGLSTKEISDLLGIKVKTVATHRDRTLGKLGFKNSIQLTRWALRAGIASLDD